jgi:hypothetical protein
MSEGATAPPTEARWSEAFYSLLHPAQIAILEAFLWIEQPLSPTLLARSFGNWQFNTLSYHVRRLAQAGVLVWRFSEPRRGAAEHFYELAS